jgi:predicted LPLAT superfamily acyltransferase
MGIGLTLLAAAYRLLGRSLSRALARAVAAYFWITGGARRRASFDYLRRVLPRKPMWRDGLRHFATFADTALDRFAAWTSPGTLPPVEFPDEPLLDEAMAQPRGGLLLVAHLGNIDITRAVLRGPHSSRITVLAHTQHARRFTRLIASRNPRFAADVVEVTEVGVDTALQLRERIERGEWVAMAADRTPVSSGARTVTVPFLGAPAPFSAGPYLLAGLLHCPVYAMFCLAEGDRYRVYLHKFAEQIDLPRSRRGEALAGWASRYAELLERYCRQAPFQWHNFYDFWRPAAVPPAE